MSDSVLGSIVATVILLVLFLFGAVAGVLVEDARIEQKCLVEHGKLPHQETVAICKERVK